MSRKKNGEDRVWDEGSLSYDDSLCDAPGESDWDGGAVPYISKQQRRLMQRRAERELEAQGVLRNPVKPQDLRAKRTLWGQAWSLHLARIAEFASRLAPGRADVRSGFVVHLEAGQGRIRSLVQDSELYEVEVRVDPLAPDAWDAIGQKCAGHVGSLTELLAGRVEAGVMAQLAAPQNGLFPRANEVSFHCPCPDPVPLCRHAAATLYGFGMRLDVQPELLFRLRGVSPQDLIQRVALDLESKVTSELTGPFGADDLEEIFGVSLDWSNPP